MKTKNSLYELAEKINARLASLPTDRRPEGATRRKIQSVSYSAGTNFEATDSESNVNFITFDQAKAMLG